MARRQKSRADLWFEYRVSIYRPRRVAGYIIRYHDPDWGPKWKRTRHTRKGDAEDQAEELIRNLDRGRREVTWGEFCELYASQHLAAKSDSHREMWATVRRWIDEQFRPKPELLGDLADVKRILRWQNRIRKRTLARGDDRTPLSDSSVARYSAYLRSALNWAVRMDLLERVPPIAVGGTRSRGGAVSLADMEAICKAAVTRRPNDYVSVQRFIRGLFWSGLRLDQLRQLSWDRGSKVWLDGSRDIPLIWISSTAEKSRRDDCRYCLPEFWERACESTVRHGPVFRVNGRGGSQMAKSTLGRIISDCGKTAGICTDPETGKYASAHDMRKGCSAVLHEKYGYTTDEVALFLGHSDPEVTRKHYPPVVAQKLAAKAWHLPPGGAPGGAPEPPPE